MPRPQVALASASPLVVGSFGNSRSLAAAPESFAGCCDVAEIRLDLLENPGPEAWSHLESLPLLFTARRADEGGAGDLTAARRQSLLEQALADASLVDVELASAGEMAGLLEELARLGIPWIASWHDFEGRPDSFDRIPALAARAAEAGATCFKAAIRLHSPGDLARLAAALGAPSPLPLSLMGMGPLAPVSRLLAAQCGSVLNYGYLGDAPTAPGQWSARQLKEGIAALEMLG